MAVGIPGTGLGGVFYVTMAIAMPVRAAIASWLGEALPNQWRNVGRHLAILAGILTVMWVEVMLIKGAAAVIAWTVPADSAVADTVHQAVNHAAPALALLPFVILGVIVGGLELLRMELRWWENCQSISRQRKLGRAALA